MKPIYEGLQRTILSGPIINADETPVQVLKEPGRKVKDKSWMWVYAGGDTGKESDVFHYDVSRSHTVAYDFLENYTGWLQSDDYTAYHTAVKKIRAENAIRPFVIGRKNWLFAGTPAGAESSAILYSLVESAKLHKFSVYEYLYYILRKLPNCENQQDRDALLPFNLSPEIIKN